MIRKVYKMVRIPKYRYDNYTVIGKIINPNRVKREYVNVLYCEVCNNTRGNYLKNRVFLVAEYHMKENVSCLCSTTCRQKYLSDFVFDLEQKVANMEFIEILDVFRNNTENSKIKLGDLSVTYREKGVIKTTTAKALMKRTFSSDIGYSTVDGLNDKDRKQVAAFMSTGSYPEGTKFWRSNRKDKNSCSYWFYQCPICKEDPELFGDAVYEASCSFFKSGNKLCGCRRTPKWEPEQYIVKINRRCKESDITFKGFVDDKIKKCSNTYLKLECSKGHNWNSTSMDSFLNASTNCPVCMKLSEDGIQLKVHKKEDNDYLYVVDIGGEYIKVGRTFNLKSRLGWVKRKAQLPITILKIYKGKHLDILTAEQDVINSMQQVRYNVDWTTETFSLNSVQDIIKYLDNRSFEEYAFVVRESKSSK